jgi:hypothetical protein
MRLLASVVMLAACGMSSSTTPSATSFDGVVGGQSLPIAEAVWVVAPSSMPGGWTGQAAFVLMSTEPDLCNRATANTVIPGEQTVNFAMVDIAGTSTSPPAAPGSYIVPIESTLAPKTAWLSTSAFDAQCAHTGTGAARSGTVTTASIEGDAITGSFDVYFDLDGSGDITGTFAPQYCAGLENALHGTLPACQ